MTTNQLRGDQRHSELIVKDMELDDTSKPVSTPYDPAGKGEDDNEVEPKIATQFRVNSARGGTSCALTDIQYTVKELSWRMASPGQCSMRRLKRLARYLAGILRINVLFRYQDNKEAEGITVYSDTGFAGTARRGSPPAEECS